MRRPLRRSQLQAWAVAAVLCAAPAHAATGQADGGQPGAWLAGYTSARTLGLGGAFVANADDALGALWNPAGMPDMDRYELRFENARLFEGTSVNAAALALPGSRLPSFGLAMVSLRSGDFERTNEMNDALGTFHEGETAYVFTMAKSVTQKFALGANVKVLQQTVEDFSAGGVGFDLGAVVRPAAGLRIGASIANLGGPKLTLRDTPETFPTGLRGGISYQVLGGRGLVAAEVDRTGDAAVQLHAGAEYWVQSGLALRVGMLDDRASGGFSYRFAPQYQVDYGVADHALGLTHRVALAYRFAGFFASSQAAPEAFSPTGERATTQIQLVSRTKGDAERWTLDLVNKSGETVRRFSGPGVPPAHVEWDGKDETGLPLADGTYVYRLVVVDKQGRMLAGSPRRVEISTAGPQGEVPMVTTP